MYLDEEGTRMGKKATGEEDEEGKNCAQRF
jgi:hypothetical protein